MMKSSALSFLLVSSAVAASNDGTKRAETLFKTKKLLKGLYFVDLISDTNILPGARDALDEIRGIGFEELGFLGFGEDFILSELEKLRNDPTIDVLPNRPPHGYGTPPPQYHHQPHNQQHHNHQPSHGYGSTRVQTIESVEAADIDSHSHSHVDGGESSSTYELPSNPCLSHRTNYYQTQIKLEGFDAQAICDMAADEFLQTDPVEVTAFPGEVTCQKRCLYKAKAVLENINDSEYQMAFNADVAVVHGKKGCANVFFKPRAGYSVFPPATSGYDETCSGPKGYNIDTIVLCDCQCAFATQQDCDGINCGISTG